MLKVDCKIITKILTNRIKRFLDLFISPEQFVCVKGQSINKCNVLLRDVIFYANEQNVTAALINLDWAKAFDRVNHGFLFKILVKIGFDIHLLIG